jgi:NADPH:quinone reductase-like Zn-dependent oxidoreductase
MGTLRWAEVIKWYATLRAWDKPSPRRQVLPHQVQKFRDRNRMRPGAAGGEPHDATWFREDFYTLIELPRQGKIHPIVAERLPLAEARHAHELLESAASKGKLVLVP